MRCPTPITVLNPAFSASAELVGHTIDDRIPIFRQMNKVSKLHKPKTITVPCGKCGACQQNRRSDWTFRLKWEEKAAKSSFFITLTYDEEHINWAENITTLYKPDLQKWFKRMRKITAFRYYAVGEYGTETTRPHYHILAFFQDYYSKKDILDMLEKTWSLGQFHVGEVNDRSIHYCSKFHITTDKHKSDELGRIPEFAVMSLKPAIGANYVQKNINWHSHGTTFREYVINNGFKQRIPRYYRLKVFTDEQRALINKRREIQELNEPSKELLFDQKHGQGEYYKAILAKAKAFKRKVKTDRF